jgi:hypothetical protein
VLLAIFLATTLAIARSGELTGVRMPIEDPKLHGATTAISG